MQRTKLAKTMRSMVAVLVMVSAFTLLGCGGDDEERASFNLNATPVAVNSTTVAAVQGQTIALPAGTVFNAGAAGVNLTFNSATTATLSRAGAASSNANVTFGSCTFVVQAGGFIPAGTYTFPTCDFQITASNVEQGGASTTGTLVFVLSGPTGTSTSATITIQVSIREDGVILINNFVTLTDVDSGTGASGATSN